MNITSLIKVDKLKDIPNALRALAFIVENDIQIQGPNANAIGSFDQNDDIEGDFNYVIDNENITSIGQWVDSFKLEEKNMINQLKISYTLNNRRSF